MRLHMSHIRIRNRCVTYIVQLYEYVTVTYVYACHMLNLKRVQIIRTLQIIKFKDKSMQ